MSERLEDWVKIRAILDVSVVEVAKYKRGDKPLSEVVASIRGLVAEMYGARLAEEAARVVEESASEDVGEIVSRLQGLLVKRVFGW